MNCLYLPSFKSLSSVFLAVSTCGARVMRELERSRAEACLNWICIPFLNEEEEDDYKNNFFPFIQLF